MQKRLCENHRSDGGQWRPDVPALQFTCSCFRARVTQRGGMKIIAEDVLLDPTTDAESVLVQLDQKDVIAFLVRQGFRVTQENNVNDPFCDSATVAVVVTPMTSELAQREANADHQTEMQVVRMNNHECSENY